MTSSIAPRVSKQMLVEEAVQQTTKTVTPFTRACHILMYCPSLNLPPLNPGVTNFQCHSFKISATHPLPSIVYFPLHVIHCLVSAQNSHTVYIRPISRTKNIAPLLIVRLESLPGTTHNN